MKTNRLRELMDSESSVLGTAVNLTDPAAVEIAALAGFVVVVIDLEHTAISFETLLNHLRAAAAHNVGTLVRVRSHAASDVLHVLDAGANGVLVPHVMDAEAASQAVAAVRYPPAGERGMFGGARSAEFGGHGLGGPAELIEWLNTNTVLAVMIEDPSAIDEIDKIVQTPGIDMVLVGTNDLSVAMGLAGTKDHPEIVGAVQRVVAAAKNAGIRVASGPEAPVYYRTARELRDDGAWLLLSKSDTVYMLEGMRAAVTRLKAS
jgi:4-hydroxy-2-oxoheptanedioate aldolase